jgi:predicted DNA-binding protein (UPF0251 family)
MRRNRIDGSWDAKSFSACGPRLIVFQRAREAVRLAYFEGLSGKEIAAKMGITPPTASEHLALGAVMLTDILNSTPAEGSAKP